MKIVSNVLEGISDDKWEISHTHQIDMFDMSVMMTPWPADKFMKLLKDFSMNFGRSDTVAHN